MEASRARNSSAKTNVALIFASITALLVFTALVVAFTVQPPALGWVGFGLASAVVLAIGAAATFIVPRIATHARSTRDRAPEWRRGRAPHDFDAAAFELDSGFLPLARGGDLDRSFADGDVANG